MFIKVGWMYKFGHTFPFAWWSLYWFVLDQLTCSLTYFKSPKNPKRKGYLNLDGNHILLTHDKMTWVYIPPWLKREQLFGILTQKKTLTLCCYYTGETESWLEVLDMFRPELFDKRMDAAEKISKCMQFNLPYRRQRDEDDRLRQMDAAKNVLESHLPVHSRIYGFGKPAYHPPPRRSLEPQGHVPYGFYLKPNIHINPHIAENLKNLATRALMMVSPIPPGTQTSRQGSVASKTSGKTRCDERPYETKMNDILGVLTDTNITLNDIAARQQEQHTHITNLENIMQPKEGASPEVKPQQ